MSASTNSRFVESPHISLWSPSAKRSPRRLTGFSGTDEPMLNPSSLASCSSAGSSIGGRSMPASVSSAMSKSAVSASMSHSP